MPLQKLSAFTRHGQGGNPAGVLIADYLPDTAQMQAIAADVGYSETVFAAPNSEAESTHWRTRYFSPENEVPFCGHATIALGAALARKHGSNQFQLRLNNADILVDGQFEDGALSATLVSPPTLSRALTADEISDTLSLFNYEPTAVANNIPPAFISAGASHFLIPLKTRQDLSTMHYDLAAGRRFMQARELVTVAFIVEDTDGVMHARNAFASGGVLEDPATGAAAAALGGYLRDHLNASPRDLIIHQGDDMGRPSTLRVKLGGLTGSGIHLSGDVTVIAD